ncbi:uncharacterized protein TNCV_3083251 [Trichonephila clavipes]|nr:uncharacterized protein TNCV_3083251 [Trichonephila clavipes]
MAFLLRERKGVLFEVAKELGVEVDITLPKVEFKKRICRSKYYNDEAAKCLLEGILEEKHEKREIKEREEREIKEFEERNSTTEVSEPVSKCRPLINPVVNKSPENALSCDFENENCDPPLRWTNVFPPSEVRGIGTEKNNRFKVEKGKEINVYRSSDCKVKVKAGVFEGSVRAMAMCAQRVINADDIGVGFLELIGDKGVANPEGLIWESNCEEKVTIVTLMGGEKQLTVDRESFRNHTMAKIAGQLNGGKENLCKVRKGLGDGLAMQMPHSKPRGIDKSNLETDNTRYIQKISSVW